MVAAFVITSDTLLLARPVDALWGGTNTCPKGSFCAQTGRQETREAAGGKSRGCLALAQRKGRGQKKKEAHEKRMKL